MRNPEITKKRILDSTIDLISEKGYKGTSTKEIATRAGVSEAIIFKYYQNKEELLMTIVRETVDEIHDYSFHYAFPEKLKHIENRPVTDLLYDIIVERINYFTVHSKKFQVIFQEMMINERIRKYYKEKVWSKLDRLSQYLFEKGKREGIFKDIDSAFMQKALFGMLFYTTILEPVFELKGKDYDPHTQAKMVLEVLFHGIKK